MRILSSPKVVEEADKVVRLIVDFYPKPNKTFSELRAMMNDNSLDLLRTFRILSRRAARTGTIFRDTRRSRQISLIDFI